MTCDERFEELWTDFLEGEITADGMVELQSLLQDQPHLQTKAGDLLQTHRLLSFALQDVPTAGESFVRRTLEKLPQADGTFREAVLERIQRAAPNNTAARRRTWHSAAAIAAGLLLGIVCTTVVFAYVDPAKSRATTLFEESFESGPAPQVTGVPLETDQWAGDFTEVVEARQGVTPESGSKMLQFLRGDYAGRSLPNSFGSDVFRLIDVRPYRREFAGGEGVVQLSALFNSVDFPAEGAFECTLTIFAVDAEIVNNQALKIEGTLSGESLAYSRSSRLLLDRDPTTWQKVSNELRLPKQTDYVMVRIGISDVARRKGKSSPGFVGHFADHVQFVIAHRPEIPVP
jgi:hypothetical protein